MTGTQALLAASGLLGLIFFALSGAVTRQRAITKTMLGGAEGVAGKEQLHIAVRAQANFAEYVPFCLLLLGFIDYAHGSAALIKILAAALVVGRIAHAVGLPRAAPNPLRAGGALITWAVLVMASFAALKLAF